MMEIISWHRLKDLDILLMKSVGKRVNIIPVIAKSDALTRAELLTFKQQVGFVNNVWTDHERYEKISHSNLRIRTMCL